MRLRNLGIALVATAAIGLVSAAPASAQHHGWGGHGGHWGGHGGHWGGGFGPGFVGGLALGAAVGGPYYGYYGYDGPYAYDYGDYAYAAPACYLRREVVVNHWGERIVRRVRVCD